MTEPPAATFSDYLATRGGGAEHRHPFWEAARATQQDRYERILVAAITIAREGGYDAVQMREVAARSGVALATAYTYFQSRDYLVYRAVVTWNHYVSRRLSPQRGGDVRPVGRTVTEIIDHMASYLAALEAEPRLLETWLRSTLTDDPLVGQHLRDVHWSNWVPNPAAEDDIESAYARALPLISDVFYATAMRWCFGHEPIDTARRRAQDLARYLLVPGSFARSDAAHDADQPT